MTVEELIGETLEHDKKMTKGPWSVWDGPLYVGGGADLCIATGDGSDQWLANMDHRHNHYAGCHNHAEHDTTPSDPNREICPICSFSDEITKEQRATANGIAFLRNHAATLAQIAERAMKVVQKEAKNEFSPQGAVCRAALANIARIVAEADARSGG